MHRMDHVLFAVDIVKHCREWWFGESREEGVLPSPALVFVVFARPGIFSRSDKTEGVRSIVVNFEF